MAAQLLHEANARLERSSGGTNRWKATLITPGKGSSGTYSEELLETFGGIAFPKGSKNWFKHPEWSGEQRDPRDQWGYLATDPVFEPGVGLTAEVQVLPHWADVVNALAEAGHAHLSIYAMGDSDEFGNVTALLPDVTNSIDLVDYPGRPGSGLTEQMLESAFGRKKPAAASAEENKEHDLDKEILEALTALTESLKPVVDFVTEKKEAAERSAQAEADAEAVERGVEERIEAFEEKVTAIEAVENLSPKQVESLKSAAKRGEDITESLAEAKAIADDFATRLGERDSAGTPGFVTESRTPGAALDLNVPGWSN